MPDDRLFHLALGHSEKVNKLTAHERDVWFVYKLAADDFGVMRFSATPLQDAARWLEEQPSKRILRALASVVAVGLVQSFEHQGQAYVFDPVWQTWQKIIYPRATKQPAPPRDALDLNTRWLFEHHPKGAKLTSWQHPDERQHSGKLPGKLPEVSEKIPGKDLESSRPVLVGSSSDRVRDRVGGGAPPAAADARSKHPVYTSDRFAVFEWQFDELSKTLGAHFEAFDIHAFFDDLTQQSRADGLVLARADVWPWLQAKVLDEAKRRGLPMASAAPSVDDRKARERAQDERILAEIQEERRLRAGR
jgi:hypothetical protein